MNIKENGVPAVRGWKTSNPGKSTKKTEICENKFYKQNDTHKTNREKFFRESEISTKRIVKTPSKEEWRVF